MKIISEQEILEDYYHRFPLSDHFGFNVGSHISVVKFDSDENILDEGEYPKFLYYLINGEYEFTQLLLFDVHKENAAIDTYKIIIEFCKYLKTQI